MISRAAFASLVLAVAAGCPSSSKGKGTGPDAEAKPPAPPPGSRFLCDRAPFDPRVTWRDCQLSDRPLAKTAFCFSARAASGNGRIHSLCSPVQADCQRWYDARKQERQDVVDPCVPLKPSQTGSLDGSPPPTRGQFLCEQRPDPRRHDMRSPSTGWRDCKVVDVDEAASAHCFVTSWRGGRHSVCAPTSAECEQWSQARAAEQKDVIAPCKPAGPTDFWPLASPR